MAFFKLERTVVEKPWGRTGIATHFLPAGADASARIGEVWYARPGADDALMIKYLFTSERLSIQVHPDDEAARAAGFVQGKEEAWLILDAEPDATIAIGPSVATTRETLKQAAVDGSIADLMDWHAVKDGDCLYSPAGTVHAIGGGLTLLEVQQNTDCTYRLFDYGRPRELHLDEGMAVANPLPYAHDNAALPLAPGRRALAHGRKFVMEMWEGGWSGTVSPEPGRPLWLVPLEGTADVDGAALAPGEAGLADGDVALSMPEGGRLVAAYPGPDPVMGLRG